MDVQYTFEVARCREAADERARTLPCHRTRHSQGGAIASPRSAIAMGMSTHGRDRGGSSCPVCGKASAAKAKASEAPSAFPFCSARCRTIDLGHWLDERYRLEDDFGAPVRGDDAQD